MIAIAALSARPLAVWAAADGRPAVVLDCFGDADTRRAALEWRPVGAADRLALDGERLLAELASLRGRAEAWVAGSGFDDQPELLCEAAAVLPLLGTDPQGHARTRDARAFFVALDRLDLPHPPVAFEAPPATAGWLLKDPRSSAGAAVRRWAGGAAQAHEYWQREVDGTVMSATFVANGADAVVLGLNRLLAAAQGDRPFVFRGAVGPVAAPPRLQREVDSCVRRLAREFGVRGLASLDFIESGSQPLVLELNARPSATAALYPRVGGASPLQAHLRACREGTLPPAAPGGPLRGTEVVYARRTVTLSAAAAAFLAAQGSVHDLPVAGARFEPGHPLCTIEAEVTGPEDLATWREQLLDTVEGLS